MTQCEQMLDYMKKHGSITGMESIGLGIMNYKGRINDLRNLGFVIDTKMEKHTNAQGETKSYARYILRGQ